MGRENIITGRAGEAIAAAFLKGHGYRIIGRNVATPFGEIDMVTRKGAATVFIEVKTRTTASLGPPYLAVTWMKQRHIIKNALFYLARRGLVDAVWRIDVVSVKLRRDHTLEEIELLENAVERNYI